MERKFYPENFEKFLKGHADQFKLTPSKKVWHGIYNDLHPGRRWPSVTMSMVFIFTLVIIGHLNTNNGHNTTPLYDISSAAASNNVKQISNSNAVKRSATRHGIVENIPAEMSAGDYQPLNFRQLSVAAPGIDNIQVSLNTSAGTVEIPDAKTNYIIESKLNNAASQNKNEISSHAKIENIVTKISPAEVALTANPLESAEKISYDKAPISSTTVNTEKINPVVETSTPGIPQATAQRIHKPKKNNNITWTYYLAPSISYRYLSDEAVNNAVIQKAMLGYEGGAVMGFNIFKKLQLTTGFQINYAGYNIMANNTHPTIATLILNTETTGQYSVYTTSSFYGNSTGTELTKLKNYSLQASVPIGLQYNFGGTNNIRFGALAAFQPSYVIAGKAYMLSSDKRNYLTDQDLLRKWNMNANFTPYITFNSNSLKWQIGPQVRYQFLSTYSTRYPVNEHLVNYGIRIGISKISK